MKLSLDGYTQITSGTIQKGDLVEKIGVFPLQEACGLIGQNINDVPDWKCYRKIKLPPSLPAHLTPPPKDYVFLGKVKDIVTPESWKNNNPFSNESVGLAIICSGDEEWFEDFGGWMPYNSEEYIAAKVGSPLYNMQNFTAPNPVHWNPRYSNVECPDGYRFLEEGETPAIGDEWLSNGKSWCKVTKNQTNSPIGFMQLPFIRPLSNNSPDLSSEIAQLKDKLRSAEEGRDMYHNLYNSALSEWDKVRKELGEIKDAAKKLNSLLNT